VKNNCIFNIICRIEEEEVDTYATFDQNNDGTVSQDEKDVSILNNKIYVIKMILTKLLV